MVYVDSQGALSVWGFEALWGKAYYQNLFCHKRLNNKQGGKMAEETLGEQTLSIKQDVNKEGAPPNTSVPFFLI